MRTHTCSLQLNRNAGFDLSANPPFIFHLPCADWLAFPSSGGASAISLVVTGAGPGAAVLATVSAKAHQSFTVTGSVALATAEIPAGGYISPPADGDVNVDALRQYGGLSASIAAAGAFSSTYLSVALTLGQRMPTPPLGQTIDLGTFGWPTIAPGLPGSAIAAGDATQFWYWLRGSIPDAVEAAAQAAGATLVDLAGVWDPGVYAVGLELRDAHVGSASGGEAGFGSVAPQQHDAAVWSIQLGNLGQGVLSSRMTKASPPAVRWSTSGAVLVMPGGWHRVGADFSSVSAGTEAVYLEGAALSLDPSMTRGPAVPLLGARLLRIAAWHNLVGGYGANPPSHKFQLGLQAWGGAPCW